jgi:ankyrin repeat protein
MIIPPMIQEELSVEEAKRRLDTLTASIRPQTAYTLFRRVLAFAVSLTSLQQVFTASAYVLDRGPIDFNTSQVFLHDMSNSMFFWPPIALIIGMVAFNINLKSAVEQYVIYLAARKALGAVPFEQGALLPQRDSENRQALWRSHLKTYAPAFALIVFIIGFHLSKFPWMNDRIEYSDLYSVKALHASGVPVPLSLNTPIYEIPVFARSPELAGYLIEKGMDINTPLRISTAVSAPFGRAGEGVMSPLMAALSFNSIDVARLLIERGADAHGQDSFGRTTLATAVLHCPEAIEPLLASGADINEQTRFGSPLLLAARYQWPYYGAEFFSSGLLQSEQSPQIRKVPNAVKLLLEKGADPNARDHEGRNALMLISMDPNLGEDLEKAIEARKKIEPILRARRNEKLVKLIGEPLLNAGCDANAADNKGRTPLMYAAAFEGSAVVNLLLKRGANVKAKDHDGLSAADWAIKSGNDEIASLILTFSLFEISR